MIGMRLVCLFTMVLTFTGCSFAQRVNRYGEKVVSEVVFWDRSGSHYQDTKYSFTYDDDLILKGIKVYERNFRIDDAIKPKYEILEEFSLVNDELIRTSHESAWRNLSWTYEFDTYGNIARFVETTTYDDKSINQFVEEFDYEYNKAENRRRIFRMHNSEWYKPKGYKTFFKQDISLTSTYKYDKEEKYKKDGIDYVINDTNIDLWKFFDYHLAILS